MSQEHTPGEDQRIIDGLRDVAAGNVTVRSLSSGSAPELSSTAVGDSAAAKTVCVPASVNELLGFVQWALENDHPVNAEHIVSLCDAVKDAYRAHPVSPSEGEPVGFFQWNEGWSVWEQVVELSAGQQGVQPLYAHPSATSGDPQTGRWYAAEDIDRMVRDIDVAMNGGGAAEQAKLCDIFGQVMKLAETHPSATERMRATLEAIRDRATNSGGNWYGDVARAALAEKAGADQ